MDFFEQEESARKRSRLLVVLFLLAVAGIIVVVYLATSIFWFAFLSHNLRAGAWRLWDLRLLSAVAFGTGTIIGLGSLYRTSTLRRGGGEAVAGFLGGRLLDRSTRNADERRLLNVVEEMALASGIPVPAVFVLERERSINAFAAGYSRDHAVIGVTRGCMELLSRDELQGVIGHEFSHILNGDMLLNIRLMGLVHGILVIALIGYVLLRGGRSSRKSGGQIAVIGVTLYIVGYLGVIFGKIIRAAVSRQREFLADASAVQFTRNPEGIAGALKKIGGLAAGSRIQAPRAEEAAHIFFGEALARGIFGVFATHPPLAERIRRIDPRFDGTYPAVAPREESARTEAASKKPAAGRKAPPPAPVPGFPLGGVAAGAAILGAGAASAGAGGSGSGGAGAGRPAGPGGVATPSGAVDRVASPTRDHLDHTRAFLSKLDPALVTAAREIPGAVAVVYAVLIGGDPEVRSRQLRILDTSAAPVLRQETRKMLAALGRAPAAARLPLMDLAVPSLRRLSAAQFQELYTNVAALSEADDRIDLFELALKRALLDRVAPLFGVHRAPEIRFTRLPAMATGVSALLSGLAHAGHPDSTDQARGAFEAGRAALGAGAGDVKLLPPEACTTTVLARALDEASKAAPSLKAKILAAGTASVTWDRRVTMEEAELLRALGYALGCPTPPFIPGVEI